MLCKLILYSFSSFWEEFFGEFPTTFAICSLQSPSQSPHVPFLGGLTWAHTSSLIQSLAELNQDKNSHPSTFFKCMQPTYTDMAAKTTAVTLLSSQLKEQRDGLKGQEHQELIWGPDKNASREDFKGIV